MNAIQTLLIQSPAAQAVRNAFSKLRPAICSIFPCMPVAKMIKSESDYLKENIHRVKVHIAGSLPESAIRELAMSWQNVRSRHTVVSYRAFQIGTSDSIEKAIPYVKGFVKYHGTNVPLMSEQEVSDLFNFLDIAGDNFNPCSSLLDTHLAPDPTVRISVFRVVDNWKTVSIFSVFKNEILLKSLRIEQRHYNSSQLY